MVIAFFAVDALTKSESTVTRDEPTIAIAAGPPDMTMR